MDANEINKALSENPELAKQVSELGGYVVKTTAEQDAFKTNIENDAISRKTSEFASSIENDIYEATGITKEPNEKWYDYQKRTYSTLSEKANSVTKYKKQIEELKENSSQVDETIRKEYQEYKALIPQLEEKHKNEILELQANFNNQRKSSEIESSLTTMSFSKSLPENLVEMAKKSAVQDLSSMKSEYRDGKLVFLDDNGETLRNKDNNLEPFTAGELLASKLVDVMATANEVKGLGTKPSDAEKTVEGVVIDGSIKSQVELDRKLGELGLSTTSNEYIKQRNAHMRGYEEANGRPMPLR